jgi:hypothetical protein
MSVRAQALSRCGSATDRVQLWNTVFQKVLQCMPQKLLQTRHLHTRTPHSQRRQTHGMSDSALCVHVCVYVYAWAAVVVRGTSGAACAVPAPAPRRQSRMAKN